QQRYYDPLIPRFLSVDPITAYSNPVGAFNRYWYANNNPYKFTDPDGRIPLLVLIIYGIGLYLTMDNANAPGPNDMPMSGMSPGEQIVAALPPGKAIAPIRAAVSGGDKTYTTYTRTRQSDGTTYSGRTSGRGSAEQQVANRTSNPDHQAKTAEGYGPGVVDKNSSNPDAIRGREQRLIQQNGGAQSQGGTSGNTINGVSPNNPNSARYDQACKKEFGCS
ncbi:RHS repeat-associated core domain-containing protein, partial [Stenotrophomonas acidaminiphila]|uniref:RHS repeat-associated core domain-containing protein n=1 Tax=Stenotrophomonas acidaminiphila TaxID=128780 RepID=UPI0028AEB0ED